MTIVILSGGTGTPKLLKGFDLIKQEINHKVVVIANTGDDWDFYGLYVSPDVDAVLYLLSGLLDTKKYWGIKNDTLNAVESLKILQEDIWFNLGDKDMGMCLYRTHLRSQGKSLTEITEILRKKLQIEFEVIPMSNDPIQTYFNTVEGRFHLEEYFIKHRNKFKINSIDFDGADIASVPKEIKEILNRCKLLIIGPSNPVSSIGPILYPKFKNELSKSTCPKVVVSPVIGQKAVSGPTEQYMLSQGFKSTPEGIIEFYKDVADIFIFHISDKNEKLPEKYPDKKIYFENILFSNEDVVKDFARKLINQTLKSS
ncbi:MAG: 2-phospho-L-lactate transferase CofD family protein [Candidatus Hodarchaeales archaeon]|jgi:LPPG:FO 2-phospho-L-lactate transferase